MGRDRIRDGIIVMGEPTARQQRIAAHARHIPNPSKLKAGPISDKNASTTQEPATSPAIEALNIRRLEILAQNPEADILRALPATFRKRLKTPYAGNPRLLEQEAMGEQLDTIETILMRFQARAICEALRNQIQIIIRDNPSLARVILGSLQYDIDEDLATKRPSHCDARSNHFRAILTKFQPAKR